jgi:hypothetical protein
MDNTEQIGNIFSKITRLKEIHEAVLMVEDQSGDFSVNYGYKSFRFQLPSTMD